MSWQFIMASGTISGLGVMFFTIGKRREQYLRMFWGACLVLECFVFSSSWPGLLICGAAFTTLAWFKPE